MPKSDSSFNDPANLDAAKTRRPESQHGYFQHLKTIEKGNKHTFRVKFNSEGMSDTRGAAKFWVSSFKVLDNHFLISMM
jgi:hypothetical protein